MIDKIIAWIEHLLTVYEDGTKDNDILKKLLDVMKTKPDEKTIADLHKQIYDIWFAISRNNPIGLDPRADIAYAAELMTRPKVDDVMLENASIALCGAACKSKSTLVVTKSGDMDVLSGWNHKYFTDEKTWQNSATATEKVITK
jgi:hypothetical protein